MINETAMPVDFWGEFENFLRCAGDDELNVSRANTSDLLAEIAGDRRYAEMRRDLRTVVRMIVEEKRMRSQPHPTGTFVERCFA